MRSLYTWLKQMKLSRCWRISLIILVASTTPLSTTRPLDFSLKILHQTFQVKWISSSCCWLRCSGHGCKWFSPLEVARAGTMSSSSFLVKLIWNCPRFVSDRFLKTCLSCSKVKSFWLTVLDFAYEHTKHLRFNFDIFHRPPCVYYPVEQLLYWHAFLTDVDAMPIPQEVSSESERWAWLARHPITSIGHAFGCYPGPWLKKRLALESWCLWVLFVFVNLKCAETTSSVMATQD